MQDSLLWVFTEEFHNGLEYSSKKQLSNSSVNNVKFKNLSRLKRRLLQKMLTRGALGSCMLSRCLCMMSGFMVHAANQVTVYSVYSAFSSAPRMNQSILVDRVDRQTRYSPSTVLRRSVKQSYSRISTYLIIEGSGRTSLGIK